MAEIIMGVETFAPREYNARRQMRWSWRESWWQTFMEKSIDRWFRIEDLRALREIGNKRTINYFRRVAARHGFKMEVSHDGKMGRFVKWRVI